MIKSYRHLLVIFFIIIVDFTAVVYGIKEVSISYFEAKIFYLDSGFLHFLVNLIGQDEQNLRVLFALFHIISILLMYKISQKILTYPKDAIYSTLIFVLLPGFYSSAMIINYAGFILMLTLIFIYVYLYHGRLSYLLLPMYLLVDNSFNALYFALIFYALNKRDDLLIFLSLGLFGLSMYIYGYDAILVFPKGYFLDYFGLYLAIFSPPLFLYFIYSLYRVGIRGSDRNIIWYISFTTLIFTLLLSIRQKILLDELAPFVIIAIPIMVKVFLHSYRVRIPQYRKRQKFIANITLWVLFLNYIILVFNKSMFMVQKDPKRHFAYNHYIAKELVIELKKLGINQITTHNERLALRLKFYNISSSDRYTLTTNQDKAINKIDIVYFGNHIITYYVSKLNTPTH
jgi:hypothetical protein